MATAILDPLDAPLSAKFERGRYTEIKRSARITGIAATTYNGILAEMLSATGLPVSGSSIVISGSTLFLDSLEPSLNADQKTIGQVTLTYVRRESSSSEPGGEVPTLEVSTQLKQVQTPFDAAGNPINVSFTWPADATQQYDDGSSKAGTTETLTGTINVMIPTTTLTGTIQVATNSPGVIAREYGGKLNAVAWQGGAPRTWKCTNVTGTLVDDSVSPNIYEFSFSFEYDEKTWDDETTAVFIDSSTGEPPDGIGVGNGITKVQYYAEKNFNEDF